MNQFYFLRILKLNVKKVKMINYKTKTMCKNNELQEILQRLPKDIVDIIYDNKTDMEKMDERRKYFKKSIYPEIKKKGRKRKRYEFVGKEKILEWMRILSSEDLTIIEQREIFEKIFNHVWEFIYINRYTNDIMYNQLNVFLICLLRDNSWGNAELMYEKIVGIPYM
jgi:hypothetical protein